MPLARRLKWFEVVLIALIFFVLVAVFFPVYTDGGPTPSTACLSQVKQMAMGQVMYLSDYDDHFTLASWMDLEVPYTKTETIFHDPIWKDDQKGNYGYAFDSRLFGQAISKQPDLQVMLYDSTNIARNSADPMTSMPKPGRHNGRDVFAYADGHVRSIAEVPASLAK